MLARELRGTKHVVPLKDDNLWIVGSDLISFHLQCSNLRLFFNIILSEKNNQRKGTYPPKNLIFRSLHEQCRHLLTAHSMSGLDARSKRDLLRPHGDRKIANCLPVCDHLLHLLLRGLTLKVFLAHLQAGLQGTRTE